MDAPFRPLPQQSSQPFFDIPPPPPASAAAAAKPARVSAPLPPMPSPKRIITNPSPPPPPSASVRPPVPLPRTAPDTVPPPDEADDFSDSGAVSETTPPPIRPTGNQATMVPMSDAVAGFVRSVSTIEGEQTYFRQVYEEFIELKRKCGEPTDTVTYEKFQTKLVQNKEQLVAKYGCRAVKFQVYVKDGKAALKATPIRS
jgi:hypothetical protein